MVKDTWKLDVVFWPNKVVKEIRVIDDKNSLHGPYKSFFDNHNPHIQGFYDDEGKKHGKFLTWDRDGNLLSSEHFDHGILFVTQQTPSIPNGTRREIVPSYS